MTTETPKPKNDSSEETVIGFKGSEQHHNLKNQPGENGDPDHASGSAEANADLKDAVEGSDAEGAVSAAMKDAVEK